MNRKISLKRLASCIAVSLGLAVWVAPTGSANTAGCPNTWVIDTSSSRGTQELMQAKEKLGANMALTYKEVYSDWSGQLGPMLSPAVKWLSEENKYLYGGTKVTTVYSVQVKDCPEKVEFRFVRAWDDRTFTKIKPQEFAENNADSFVDFTYVNTFDNCIKKKIESLVKDFQTHSQLRQNKWQTRWPSELQGPIYSSGSEKSSNCGYRSALIPISMTPNCKWIIDIKENASNPYFLSFGPSVAVGGKCDFGFSTYVPSSTIEMPLFGLFTLDSSILKSTITCAKGKLTQKVTAVKPKCPSGYKVKK